MSVLSAHKNSLNKSRYYTPESQRHFTCGSDCGPKRRFVSFSDNLYRRVLCSQQCSAATCVKNLAEVQLEVVLESATRGVLLQTRDLKHTAIERHSQIRTIACLSARAK